MKTILDFKLALNVGSQWKQYKFASDTLSVIKVKNNRWELHSECDGWQIDELEEIEK